MLTGRGTQALIRCAGIAARSLVANQLGILLLRERPKILAGLLTAAIIDQDQAIRGKCVTNQRRETTLNILQGVMDADDNVDLELVRSYLLVMFDRSQLPDFGENLA